MGAAAHDRRPGQVTQATYSALAVILIIAMIVTVPCTAEDRTGAVYLHSAFDSKAQDSIMAAVRRPFLNVAAHERSDSLHNSTRSVTLYRVPNTLFLSIKDNERHVPVGMYGSFIQQYVYRPRDSASHDGNMTLSSAKTMWPYYYHYKDFLYSQAAYVQREVVRGVIDVDSDVLRMLIGPYTNVDEILMLVYQDWNPDAAAALQALQGFALTQGMWRGVNWSTVESHMSQVVLRRSENVPHLFAEPRPDALAHALQTLFKEDSASQEEGHSAGVTSPSSWEKWLWQFGETTENTKDAHLLQQQQEHPRRHYFLVGAMRGSSVKPLGLLHRLLARRSNTPFFVIIRRADVLLIVQDILNSQKNNSAAEVDDDDDDTATADAGVFKGTINASLNERRMRILHATAGTNAQALLHFSLRHSNAAFQIPIGDASHVRKLLALYGRVTLYQPHADNNAVLRTPALLLPGSGDVAHSLQSVAALFLLDSSVTTEALVAELGPGAGVGEGGSSSYSVVTVKAATAAGGGVPSENTHGRLIMFESLGHTSGGTSSSAHPSVVRRDFVFAEPVSAIDEAEWVNVVGMPLAEAVGSMERARHVQDVGERRFSEILHDTLNSILVEAATRRQTAAVVIVPVPPGSECGDVVRKQQYTAPTPLRRYITFSTDALPGLAEDLAHSAVPLPRSSSVRDVSAEHLAERHPCEPEPWMVSQCPSYCTLPSGHIYIQQAADTLPTSSSAHPTSPDTDAASGEPEASSTTPQQLEHIPHSAVRLALLDLEEQLNATTQDSYLSLLHHTRNGLLWRLWLPPGHVAPVLLYLPYHSPSSSSSVSTPKMSSSDGKEKSKQVHVMLLTSNTCGLCSNYRKAIVLLEKCYATVPRGKETERGMSSARAEVRFSTVDIAAASFGSVGANNILYPGTASSSQPTGHLSDRSIPMLREYYLDTLQWLTPPQLLTFNASAVVATLSTPLYAEGIGWAAAVQELIALADPSMLGPGSEEYAEALADCVAHSILTEKKRREPFRTMAVESLQRDGAQERPKSMEETEVGEAYNGDL